MPTVLRVSARRLRPYPRLVRRPSLKELLGAILLAFGTIFQPKARDDDHWSTRPTVEIVEEAASEAAGGKRSRRRLPSTA